MAKKDHRKSKKYDTDDAATNLMMETLPPKINKNKNNNNNNKNNNTNNNNKNNTNKSNNKGSSIGKKVLLLGRLDSCHNCIRYLLVLGNCIFFLLGCTIIGLGIYVVVDKVSFVTGLFGLTLVAPASYLILASGCVVFIISFIGCFGALFESRSLLAIYSGFLAVVLALSCIGFSLAVIFRSNVTDQIRLYMRRTVLYDYGINPEQQWNVFVTKKWDQAQVKWQCCAVKDNTWTLYRESSWYRGNRRKSIKDKFNNNLNFNYNNLNFNDNSTSGDYGNSYDDKVIEDIVDLLPLVPKSCCKINNNGHYVDLKTCRRGLEFFKSRGIQDYANSSSQFTRSVNTKGCYEEGTDVMHEISRYLICIGVITAVVVIGGLIISIQLARHV